MSISFWKKKKKIDEQQFPCPRDGKLMDKKIINDVIIDICPKCKGIWLDDDEIEKLILHAQKIGLHKEQPKKKKKTKKVKK